MKAVLDLGHDLRSAQFRNILREATNKKTIPVNTYGRFYIINLMVNKELLAWVHKPIAYFPKHAQITDKGRQLL